MNTFATLIGGVGKHVHSSAGMRSRALWLARSKEPRGGVGELATSIAFTFMACSPARENFSLARPSDPLNKLKMNHGRTSGPVQVCRSSHGRSPCAVQRRVCVINFN